MQDIFFSIIIVSLNAGEKLNKTLESIHKQTFLDYEIVLKDGGSTDGSIKKLSEREYDQIKIRLIEKKDQGIYDGMNQALKEAKGKYILFMNCGDYFYAETILEKIYQVILENPNHGIYYGDTFCRKKNQVVVAPNKITGFTCYRNIPCHQSCFYENSLLQQKPFQVEYQIRADYDQFLWCFYVGEAKPLHSGLIIASYEGGGYSEEKENKKRDRTEHGKIVKKYMASPELFLYRFIMAITLVPLRRALAESKCFSGFYEGAKQRLYKSRKAGRKL